jgi:hypothetical protein
MKWKDEDLPASHGLESAVLAFWRRQPDVTDGHIAASELQNGQSSGNFNKPSNA